MTRLCGAVLLLAAISMEAHAQTCGDAKLTCEMQQQMARSCSSSDPSCVALRTNSVATCANAQAICSNPNYVPPNYVPDNTYGSGYGGGQPLESDLTIADGRR